MLISFIAFILLWKTQPKEKNIKIQLKKLLQEKILKVNLLNVNNDEVIVRVEEKT